MVYHKVLFLDVCYFLPTLCNKHFKVNHFVDDTNLPNVKHSIKEMKKKFNYDLNPPPQKKKTHSDLHLKVNRKCLYPADSVKYLGIKNVTWNHQINNAPAKLHSANDML